MQNEWATTGDEYLDSLATCGDPLERLICGDFQSLNLVLQPYSKIWKDHILHRRVEGGAFLIEEWQEFGGRHYTALIRLHHAMWAKDEIMQLCSEAEMDGYFKLLKVHSACANFWDNLGASIDNFMKAKTEAKKLLESTSVKRVPKAKCDHCGAVKPDSKFEGKTLSSLEHPKLDYAFQRRNQFIHSIIVPHQIQNGEIIFDLKHFDDETTTWRNEGYCRQELGSKIQEDWAAIITEFGNSWGALYSYLQQHDKDRPIKQTQGKILGSVTPNYKLTESSNSALSGGREVILSSDPDPSGSIPPAFLSRATRISGLS